MDNEKLRQEQEILCRNILLLRKIHGLNKKRMSQILGISVCSLNKIEQGKLPPRLSVSVIFRIYANVKKKVSHSLEKNRTTFAIKKLSHLALKR